MFLHLLLFLVLYLLTSHFLKKIRNFPPSPFPTLPLLGHLHLLKKPLHRSFSKISNRHGPILLLQFGCRRVLLVSSPSAAEECFTRNDVIFADRPRLLAGKYLGYNYTSLGWASYGDHWRNLRKISSIEIFSSNRLHALSTIRSDEVKLFVRRLFIRSDKDKGIVVDLNANFFGLIINVMMGMIGGKMCYEENVAVEVEEARRIRDIVTETFELMGTSNMEDFLPVLTVIGARTTEKRLIELSRKEDGLLQGLVDKHRKRMSGDKNCLSKEKNKSMIEVLLSLQESEPEHYKDDIIKCLMLVRSLSKIMRVMICIDKYPVIE